MGAMRGLTYKLWGASRSLWEGLGLGELHGPPGGRAGCLTVSRLPGADTGGRVVPAWQARCSPTLASSTFSRSVSSDTLLQLRQPVERKQAGLGLPRSWGQDGGRGQIPDDPNP